MSLLNPPAYGVQKAHVFNTFNNVSVVYHISPVGRVFRRLMFYAIFIIQSFTTPLPFL
jgi:hypothetical protein